MFENSGDQDLINSEKAFCTASWGNKISHVENFPNHEKMVFRWSKVWQKLRVIVQSSAQVIF